MTSSFCYVSVAILRFKTVTFTAAYYLYSGILLKIIRASLSTEYFNISCTSKIRLPEYKIRNNNNKETDIIIPFCTYKP